MGRKIFCLEVMAVLKLVGNVMIFSAAVLFGQFMAGKYQGRYRFLVEVRSALSFLEEEMLSLGLPLPEALARTGERMDGAVGAFMVQLQEAHQESLWQGGWDSILTGMGAEEGQVLKDLLRSLGKGDIHHQRQLFKTVQWRLERMEEERREEAQRYVRLWNYSGFLMGLMMILILY